MKYIPVDKLISEINARIERCEKDEEDGYSDTTSPEAILKSVRTIIDSLQQEQPEVDLEKEIERIVENEERFMKFQVKEQLIKYVARHFAEWGAIHFNARKEE